MSSIKIYFLFLPYSLSLVFSVSEVSLFSLSFSFFLTCSLPLSSPLSHTFLLHLKSNPIKSFKAIRPSPSPSHPCLSSPFEFNSPSSPLNQLRLLPPFFDKNLSLVLLQRSITFLLKLIFMKFLTGKYHPFGGGKLQFNQQREG